MEEGKPAGIFQFSLAEELVHQSEVRKYLLKHWKWENKEEFELPQIPSELPTFEGTVQFGAEMKAKHFHLDKSWTFLDHAAFGAVLKEALQASEIWRVYCEKQPLKFIEREVFQHLIRGIQKISKFIDADPDEVVFVQNVTTGIDSVVRSIIKTLQPGDSILMLDTVYPTVRFVIEGATNDTGVTVTEAVVPLPVKSPQQIVDLVAKAISPSTKLAVFDHIPGNHGFILPVKELVERCHERGIQVLVDGAHCLGSVKISMRDIGADYYVANGHKWLCSPKGTAFLYVAKCHQSIIHPLVLSPLASGNSFTSEFTWTATMDYTPYLSFLTVIDFWNHYGQENMIEYMYDTAKQAGQMLQEAWQTSLLADISMFGPMVVVKLPDGVVPPATNFKLPYSDPAAQTVMNILHYTFKIEVPVKVINGELYVRISAHVYNELSEYRALADAILTIVNRNII